MHPSHPRVHLAVDLSHVGARPAAWRDVRSGAPRGFDPARLAGLVATAERGTLDLVVLGHDFRLRPDRGQTVDGRLDAVHALAQVAPSTRGIGLVATVAGDAGRPAELGRAVATLDALSAGRAG
ncbi:LLM class flavin-dependent oxidoreductase, partial [Actinotalea sp. JY-7885]